MKKAIVLLCLILLACAPSSAPPVIDTGDDGVQDIRVRGTHIVRWVDEEAGVVCWITTSSLSCLDIDITDLRVKP